MNKKRNWYPITSLPMFLSQIERLIEALEDQHNLFLQATNNLGSLDDTLVNKATDSLKKNTEYIVPYQEQLNKWRESIQSNSQKQSLDLLAQKIANARHLNIKLIELTKEISKVTINKILEKDDIELALDFLSGKMRKND